MRLVAALFLMGSADGDTYRGFCLSGIEGLNVDVYWKCDPFSCLQCSETQPCSPSQSVESCASLCTTLLEFCEEDNDPTKCIFTGMENLCSPVCSSEKNGRCADIFVDGRPLSEYITAFPESSDVILLVLIGLACASVAGVLIAQYYGVVGRLRRKRGSNN